MAAPGLRPEPTSFPWKGSRPPGSGGRVDGNGEDLARAYTNLTTNTSISFHVQGKVVMICILKYYFKYCSTKYLITDCNIVR